MPPSPLPECARDSVAHPYAAFADRAVNASCAYPKNFVTLVTGDSLRLSKPIAETLSVLSKSWRLVNIALRCTEFEQVNTGGKQWWKYLGRHQRRKTFYLA